MLKFLNILCGTIAILVGVLKRSQYFLIPIVHSMAISTPLWVEINNIFYYPYTLIMFYIRYSIMIFYIILGLTIIYSTFKYIHTILKIMTIITAFIGIISSSFYIYSIIYFGNSLPSMALFPLQRYDKLSGFVNSLIPTIVPSVFPYTCVTIAQLLMVIAIVIIAVLKILNKPKSTIKQNFLARLLAIIVLVSQILSRFYVLIATTPSSNPYLFLSIDVPSIIPFMLSCLTCICVAYCIYRILATPNKLKV